MPTQPEVKIDCYFIKLRPNRRGRGRANQVDEYLTFDELPRPDALVSVIEGAEVGSSVSEQQDPEGATDTSSFNDLFSAYVSSIDSGFVVNDKNDLAFNVPVSGLRLRTQERLIIGTIRGGRSGSPRRVVRADRANEEPEFYMTSEHVNYQDYSYLIHLPADGNIGVLMVSGISKFSVSEVFVRHFRKHISDTYNLVAEIDRFVPMEALENIEGESEIETITLSTFNLPADSAERNLGLGFVARDLDIEVRIKGVKRYTRDIKGMLDRLRSVTGEDRPQFLTSPVLDELGLKQNERRVSFTYVRNGKRSTARSDNNFELKPYFYVPQDQIIYDDDNLPTLDSVQAYMLSHLLPMIQTDLSQ